MSNIQQHRNDCLALLQCHVQLLYAQPFLFLFFFFFFFLGGEGKVPMLSYTVLHKSKSKRKKYKNIYCWMALMTDRQISLNLYVYDIKFSFKMLFW